ncbi:MAG: tyrosine-type recombinase/integrase [Chloroflexota bacterium]|nr:tyrosine-type recombinase/integrase [Chloroflexota bacterium]
MGTRSPTLQIQAQLHAERPQIPSGIICVLQWGEGPHLCHRLSRLGAFQVHLSPHTCRAYASDLASFQAYYTGSLDGVTADTLRRYFATLSGSSPATRARKQASLASFLAWAYRQELIEADPMGKVERVRAGEPAPRGVGRKVVEQVLKAIPSAKKRDRLLFRLIYETGLRAGEALSLHVEDVELAQDDERIHVLGKGNRRRTVLLDDPALVKQLRAYLKATGYKHGPLFRAEKNGRGGSLRYQSVQELWARYCAKAGVSCTLHQLRHSHATELVNGGVGLETIRKRLGHKNIQTTLRYAEQSDAVADAEMRAWRRRQRR